MTLSTAQQERSGFCGSIVRGRARGWDEREGPKPINEFHSSGGTCRSLPQTGARTTGATAPGTLSTCSNGRYFDDDLALNPTTGERKGRVALVGLQSDRVDDGSLRSFAFACSSAPMSSCRPSCVPSGPAEKLALLSCDPSDLTLITADEGAGLHRRTTLCTIQARSATCETLHFAGATRWIVATSSHHESLRTGRGAAGVGASTGLPADTVPAERARISAWPTCVEGRQVLDLERTMIHSERRSLRASATAEISVTLSAMPPTHVTCPSSFVRPTYRERGAAVGDMHPSRISRE